MLEVQIFGGALALSLTFYILAGVALIGAVVVIYLSLRGSKRNVGMLNELILGERQQNRDGYTSVIDKSKYLGAVGVCVTDLRPSGTIEIAGEPLDVVAEGSFVKAGSRVTVINVDGSRVLVRQTEGGLSRG